MIEVSEQFFGRVLSQLSVDPSKRPRKAQAKAGTAKPLQIGEDKHGLRALLGKLYPTATLEVHFFTEAVLIRGRVARQADIQPIREIAEQYLPKVLMDLTAPDQPMTSAPKAGVMLGGVGSAPTKPDVISNAQIMLPGMSSGAPAINVTPRDDQDAAMDRDA